MASQSLAKHQELLQDLVAGLGRDDIGVGDVTESGGMVHFTLRKGDYEHRDQIPVEALTEPDRALPLVLAMLPKISKPIERQHIAKAEAEISSTDEPEPRTPSTGRV
jgi:hypothetical protein